MTIGLLSPVQDFTSLKAAIDAGADAVVGGHPHVTQDVEQYHGKPIIYSLGNFVFNGFTDQANNTGWLLRLDVDHQGARSWRTYTANIDKKGIPHPASNAKESCWERGQLEASACSSHLHPRPEGQSFTR